MRPALGIIETSSILSGIELGDALAKRAPIALLDVFSLTPGKLVTVFAGDEAPVEESYRRGLEVAGDDVLDSLILPGVEPRVVEALLARGPRAAMNGDESIGAVETRTISAAALAADAALKAAGVELLEMHLRRELGGKAWFILSGPQHDIEAALAASEAILSGGAEKLVRTLIIPRPHSDLIASLFPKGEAA